MTRRSDRREELRLLDQRGEPLPIPTSLSTRLKGVSKKTRRIIVGFAVFIAAVVAFLANLGTIVDHLPFASKPASVPLILVKLANSGGESVNVEPRGDFLLWLPGPGTRYSAGKYEFYEIDSRTRIEREIRVSSGTTVTVLAHVLNQRAFGSILEQADRDITFEVRRGDGSLVFTDDLPFSRDYIRKYFVSADITVK